MVHPHAQLIHDIVFLLNCDTAEWEGFTDWNYKKDLVGGTHPPKSLDKMFFREIIHASQGEHYIIINGIYGELFWAIGHL